MKRYNIIEKIGNKYYKSNLENGEFSYPKALKSVHKNIKEFQRDDEKNAEYLDLRFENEHLVILVECKDLFKNWDKKRYKNNCKIM